LCLSLTFRSIIEAARCTKDARAWPLKAPGSRDAAQRAEAAAVVTEHDLHADAVAEAAETPEGRGELQAAGLRAHESDGSDHARRFELIFVAAFAVLDRPQFRGRAGQWLAGLVPMLAPFLHCMPEEQLGAPRRGPSIIPPRHSRL
jgi:hypothetical protein